MKIKTIITTTLTVVVIGSLGALSLVSMKATKEAEAYSGQLEIELASIGPTAYSYVSTRDLEPGDILTESDFDSIKQVESAIPDNTISDPSEYIGDTIVIPIDARTPLTDDMFMEEYNPNTYAMDIPCNWYPVGLKPGSYVNINAVLPTGETYVALSHLRIDSINNSIPRVSMTSAQVAEWNSLQADYSQWESLGFTYYLEFYEYPGLNDATQFYPVSDQVASNMRLDPNISDEEILDFVNADIRSNIVARITMVTQEEGSKYKSQVSDMESTLEESWSTWYNSLGEEEDYSIDGVSGDEDYDTSLDEGDVGETLATIGDESTEQIIEDVDTLDEMNETNSEDE